MKKIKKDILLFILLISCNTLFISCSTSPEKYFSIAVLNTNTLYGFAGNGFSRQLESPSVKLADDNKNTVSMKRSEVVDSKVKQLEENLDKIESLKETDDTKNMLESSIALYKYVLPVYKNEYFQLAELYDNGASPEQIDILTKSIHDNYYSRYIELNDKLISDGKVYAEKHNINVKWDVKPSP